jgi:hypothetical protein
VVKISKARYLSILPQYTKYVKAAETLNNLQTKLNTVLEKLAAMFAAALERNIQEAMIQLGNKLSTIKGAQVPKDQVCSHLHTCNSAFYFIMNLYFNLKILSETICNSLTLAHISFRYSNLFRMAITIQR